MVESQRAMLEVLKLTKTKLRIVAARVILRFGWCQRGFNRLDRNPILHLPVAVFTSPRLLRETSDCGA